MGSILKALGLTIWGLIGLGLLAIFMFVGYEAALKYRASSNTAHENTANAELKPRPSGGPAPSAGPGARAPPERKQAVSVALAPPRTADSTRKLLLGAFKSQQYDSVIEYGQQLVDDNSAVPADLSAVAQSYLSIGDCANAQIWARNAKDAFPRTGMESDQALRRIAVCCVPAGNKPRIVLDPAQKARIYRLLSNTDAAKSESGGPLVSLGEVYYGFGEYELAIAAIQLGLNKGHIPHLDEAYVYLGRAEHAVGDLEGARNAFNKLKDVPGISPRVLRLWTLYGEIQLTSSMSEDRECPKMVSAARDTGATTRN